MRQRYNLNVFKDGNTYVIPASTYKEIAERINQIMGCPFVSVSVITNWMSRGLKAEKYDFINITPAFNCY